MSFFFADTKEFKDLSLYIFFMDTDGPATKLCTVEYDVISERLYLFDIFIVECLGCVNGW